MIGTFHLHMLRTTLLLSSASHVPPHHGRREQQQREKSEWFGAMERAGETGISAWLVGEKGLREATG